MASSRTTVPLMVVVGLVLMAGTPGAQDAWAPMDAKAVLQAVVKNMGGDTVRTVEITGSGYISEVGQNGIPTYDWPQYDVTAYTKTIDYGARSSREQITRRRGDPRRLGGGARIEGEQQLQRLVVDKVAWDVLGSTTTPVASTPAEIRQMDIWLMSPHGFLKAAMAAKDLTAHRRPARAAPRTQGDRPQTVLSFTMGRYKIDGFLSDDNLRVDRVRTWVANPVLGDMTYETEFRGYKDFGGIKYPGIIHQHQGDGRPVKEAELAWHGARDAFNIEITKVQTNVPVAAIAVPAAVQKAAITPVRVDARKLADGIWFMGGGDLNSLAVEFSDFIAVIEAPIDEARSIAVINETHRVIPKKPIKYVVNTHHHFDHAGGLRTYVAEGAIVITQKENVEFYETVFLTLMPRTMQPDRMSIANDWMRPTFETVNQQYSLTDGTGGRILELYKTGGHSTYMLLAYLPKEKILVEADLLNPRGPRALAPKNFVQMVQRQGFDVQQVVSLHGPVTPWSELVASIGKSSN